jgi:hypothetical protein
MTTLRPHVRALALLSVLVTAAVGSAGCDIVTADFKAKESAEWRKTYTLEPGGRVDISNVNGRIEVEPSTGNTVEVVAVKTARGASAEAAREMLERIEIAEEVSPASITIETKVPRGGFMRFGGGTEVRFTVKIPAASEGRFATVNGGIDAAGLEGQLRLETTNGGIRGRELGGPVEASTTNGGVDVEVTRITEAGIKLGCTNGGIRLRIPSNAKATISASVTNGGIDAGGLPIEATHSSRRSLEGRLNGGGAPIRLEGTNGGISINGRAGS